MEGPANDTPGNEPSTKNPSSSAQETPGAAGSQHPSHSPWYDTIFEKERLAVTNYLLEHSAEFREVSELRERGWNNPVGDRYFKKQRHNADNATDATTRHFYQMMQNVGRKMQQATGVFTHPTPTDPGRPKRILGLCMAPGGFIDTAMHLNPDARVLGLSLPVKVGGMKVMTTRRRGDARLTLKFVDVTMLAADLGVVVDDIPAAHPDAGNFLPAQLGKADQASSAFDLVTCEGGVLRTHARDAYREDRESLRLRTAQLAVGLERLGPGGCLVMLLHKPEAWETARLLYVLDRLSRSLVLFKPEREHGYRSSFYAVASGVRSQDAEARRAVEGWKREWRVATFGTDEVVRRHLQGEVLDVAEVLREFGPRLVELGKEVWATQARALAMKSFTQ